MPRLRNKDLVWIPVSIVEELVIGSGIAQTLPDQDTKEKAISLGKEIHLAGKQYHPEEDGQELFQ